MIHILYNPKSNCGKNIDEVIFSVKSYYAQSETVTYNITQISDLEELFDTFDKNDEVVVVGGDGTLNVLCNHLRGYKLKNNIYLFKAGTGNDFLRDVDDVNSNEIKAVKINEYIDNLPVVTVNGKEYLFINNVGYGIDGKVCTAGEELREKGKKDINYTTLAIKLLLTAYKSNGATVTVDGNKHSFKRVWMAPVMNGLYYGGGMMPTPNQDRNSDLLSCCVVHDTNALQTLLIFPSIFKGEHIKYKKKVTILSGKEMKIEFDKPQDVQIDGEVIRDVSEISVKKYAQIKERDEKLIKANA
ncbi:MAG: diacylglycerol kinase family protein [Ruminococcus sp.]|nr:diacylglycerol kinase family protein [Ruminococcus sp.]